MMTYAEVWKLAEELYPGAAFALNIEGWRRIRRARRSEPATMHTEIRWSLWISNEGREIEGDNADALAEAMRADCSPKANASKPEDVQGVEVPS